MSVPAGAPAPRPPLRVFIIVVAVAVILSVTIGYLGITGRIGTGIPGGEKPPAKSGSGQLQSGPAGPVSAGVASAVIAHWAVLPRAGSG